MGRIADLNLDKVYAIREREAQFYATDLGKKFRAFKEATHRLAALETEHYQGFKMIPYKRLQDYIANQVKAEEVFREEMERLLDGVRQQDRCGT